MDKDTMILPEGDIIGWKKALTPNGDYCIVKLLIPANSRRSNATGRKCRCEFAKVLELSVGEKAFSVYDNKTLYELGSVVRADRWDDCRWNECSHGIHFFITREEAEEYETWVLSFLDLAR